MPIKKQWLVNNYENEDQLQVATIVMMSQEFPRLRDKYFHVKNEAFIRRGTIGKGAEERMETQKEWDDRRMREGNKNKAMGMLAGVHDIIIVHNGIMYRNELKQPDGRVSDAQIKIHGLWLKDCPLIPNNVAYTVADTYYFCEKILKHNLKIRFPVDFIW